MSLFFSTPIRYSLVLLISALLVSGCSSSSDSNSAGTNGGSNEMEDGTTAGSETESTTGLSASEELSATRVNFVITVPAVMSDALQVRLVWGDVDTTAMWNSDELWTVSADFPANTTNQLVVTFSDGNGAITLGSYESIYRTGTNVSDSFEITADQFDTDRWDSDADGVSNLDELIVGSDPVSSDTNVDVNLVPAETLLPVSASVELLPDKTFRIRWQPTRAADFYRVLENPDGISGFTAVSGELDASTEFYDHRVALHKRVNARYMVEACNSEGCALSAQQLIEGNLIEAIGYIKASNPGRIDQFGSAVSLSGDGNTLAVGARLESSSATGINGDQSDNSAEYAGAVYIFTRHVSGWQQQAYLKASNTDYRDFFGSELSLSADGNTLAVGVSDEDSNARGVDGDQSNNSTRSAGAVYVFVRSGESWQQQAYLKASNTDVDAEPTRAHDQFGQNISLSSDGNTLAVGARVESSTALGINGDQNNNDDPGSGAVYVFTRSNSIWQQQAYIKASREGGNFGRSVSLSADGNALAVGASIANFRGLFSASAVYMFMRSSGIWREQTFIALDSRGSPIASLSGDGNTVAVAAGTSASIFERIGGSWQEQATFDQYGGSGTLSFETDGISLSADGSTLVLGNRAEGSGQKGLQGFQGVQPQVSDSGAVYVFTRGDGTWLQEVYVKASNASASNQFGASVSLSSNGDTLAVGAIFESGTTAGFNGDQTQLSGSEFGGSGAVYLY